MGGKHNISRDVGLVGWLWLLRLPGESGAGDTAHRLAMRSCRSLDVHKQLVRLVLSRKLDERIVIGDDIVITIVRIDDDKVRIGVDAPKNVTVHRKEVWEAINKTLDTDAGKRNSE